MQKSDNDAFASSLAPYEINRLRIAQRQLVRELGLIQDCKAELGITFAQSHALIEIELTPGIAQGDLAKQLLIEKSTATRMVAKLAQSGWIRIRPDANDKRIKTLHLTAAGKKIISKGHTRAQNQAQRAFSSISSEDKETILNGLKLYVRALQKQRNTI